MNKVLAVRLPQASALNQIGKITGAAFLGGPLFYSLTKGPNPRGLLPCKGYHLFDYLPKCTIFVESYCYEIYRHPTFKHPCGAMS